MFTGIIETLGVVKGIKMEGGNRTYAVRSSISSELKIDQSISHNGVCLTVVGVQGDIHEVTAIAETLAKTNLENWEIGTKVNLERCTKVGDRLDGHIVQGHVDQIGTCIGLVEQDGSWVFTFAYDASKGNVTVEKGSISVNGISLTVVNSKSGQFSVAIIPYTYEHTNLHQVKIGDTVNLEFDIIGKYVSRLMNAQH